MTKRKLFEISCKEFLMNIVKESEVLNNKLSFFQRTLLYDKIKEMKSSDVFDLLFTNEQSRTQLAGKEKKGSYAAAGAAGSVVGHATIGGRGLKVPFGPKLIKNDMERAAAKIPKAQKKLADAIQQVKNSNSSAASVKARNAAFKELEALKATASKTPRKWYKLTKGGIKGAAAAVAGLYLYRKLSDPCVRKNPFDKKAQLNCRIEAIKQVINKLEYQLNHCRYAEDPQRCQSKVNGEINKWRNTMQRLVVQQTKEGTD